MKRAVILLSAILSWGAFAVDLYYPTVFEMDVDFSVEGGKFQRREEYDRAWWIERSDNVLARVCEYGYVEGRKVDISCDIRGPYYFYTSFVSYGYETYGEAIALSSESHTLRQVSKDGTQYVSITMSNMLRISISNTTGATISIGGHEITETASSLLPMRDPLVSISQDPKKPWARFYLVDADGKETLLTNGGTISGRLMDEAYTIREDDSHRYFPTLIIDDLAGDGKSILFGSSEAPIYQTPTAKLMTEWVFVQDDFGSGTVAYVNGVNMCSGHSTGHIIAYEMVVDGDGDNWRYDASTTIMTVTFTMSIAKESSKPGGACEFRVWSGARTYDAATVRASSTGTDATVAKFRLTYQLSTGAKTLTAL